MSDQPYAFAQLDPLPPALDRTLQILETFPKYKRRRWLKGAPTKYPRFVYRYQGDTVPEEYLSNYLVHSRFYLNSVAQFNDPFDMGAYVLINNDPRKRLEKYKRILKVHRGDLNWTQRRKVAGKMMCAPNQLITIRSAYEKNIRDTGAICFTSDPRNLLMWSHYAAHHRGLVLQFSIANDLRIMGRVIKIDYSENYPVIDWVNDDGKILEIVLRTKHRGWEYEQEFRIINADSAGTYLPFHPTALTGIVFGCRASLEFKQKVLSILERRVCNSLNPLKVYSAMKHLNEYRVTIQKDLSLNWPS